MMRSETVSGEQLGQMELAWYEAARDVSNLGYCEEGWKGLVGGCKSYHEFFALFGTGNVSSPFYHFEFYKSGLQVATLDRGEKPKPVLISGTATPAMAWVALNSIPDTTPLYVFDLCRTPLEVCRRTLPQRPGDKYFQANALNLQEILDGSGVSLHGLAGICTDAFVTRFPDDEKLVVLENWARLLDRDNGVLATTWKIASKSGGGNVASHYGDAALRQQFVNDVVERLERLKGGHANGSRMIDEVSAAMDYADRMTSHAGQTLPEIESMVGKFFGHVRTEVSPSVSDVDRRTYARITARNPKVD